MRKIMVQKCNKIIIMMKYQPNVRSMGWTFLGKSLSLLDFPSFVPYICSK